MDIIYDNVAGLDVHQKTIMACVRKIQPQGGIGGGGPDLRDDDQGPAPLSDWLTSER